MRKKVIIAEDGSMDVSSTTRAWESEGDVLDLQNWETVVPESEKGVLKDFVAFGDTLICLYDSGGYSKLRAMQGTQIVDIDLPEGFPTMAGLQIRPDYGQNVLYIKYESFAMPGSLLKIDFSNQSLDGPHLKIPIPEVVKQNTPDGFDRTQLSVEEVEYKQTEDGTPMTMLVIGYGERSANPKTVVEVYGGFNATLAPSYRPDIMNFIMEGGVYIVPKLHGDAGFYDARSKGPGKNRTVEDIKDATAFVQASLGTDARQTGLIGMSNGGLMAAITGLQRYPELFGAVVCESAPADLLNFVDKERYPNQDARYWPSEYGNDPEFLRTISPIHNIAIGQTHPPLLVITGDMDTNVSPKNGHQLAAMHIKANPSIPTYLFEQTGVGHSLLTKEQKRSRMTMRQQFFNKMLA